MYYDQITNLSNYLRICAVDIFTPGDFVCNPKQTNTLSLIIPGERERRTNDSDKIVGK